MNPDNSRKGVAALERALQILNAFGDDANGLSLTELSVKTGLYKSTILRLATSLERFGYLSRLENGQFVLGATVFHLGRLYQKSFNLGEHVKPVLQKLVNAHKESASFWISEGKSRLCLFRVDSPQPIRDAAVQEGDRVPYDDSATSQVLQAFSKLDDRTYQKARDAVTIVSRGGFMRELAGVACPVFREGSKLAGAITIAGPISRFDDRVVLRMSASLLDASKSLSRELGGSLGAYDAKAIKSIAGRSLKR